MGQPNGVMEDAIDGFIQLSNSPRLLFTFIFATITLITCMLASIGVMKQLSAVHAIVFNTSRSVIVWGFSLAMSWQAFQSLQVVGFLSIVLGVLVFNDILINSMVRRCLWKKRIS